MRDERYYGYDEIDDGDFGYTEWLQQEVEMVRERYELAVYALREEAKVADAQIASLIRSLNAWCEDMDASENCLRVAEQGLAFAEDALAALEGGDLTLAEVLLDSQSDVNVNWADDLDDDYNPADEFGFDDEED